MSIELSNINLEKVTTLGEAKQCIAKLINLVEELHQENQALLTKNQQLEREIARLKKQPLPPQFSSKNYSPTKKLENIENKEKPWKKSAKKETIEIDQEVELPEVEVCNCGNQDFKTLRTTEKIVQDIIIRRNNTRYTGRDKQCLKCGQIHKIQIPEEIKGLTFGGELRSWISYFKFEGRLSEALIHNFLTDLGIKISKGQISNILLKNSKKLQPSYTHLKVWGFRIPKYLQTDATGAKRKLKKASRIINQYLHFVGHQFLSFFVITRRYNGEVMTKIFGKRGRDRICVGDDHGANGSNFPVSQKQLCFIHEMRHYFKLNPQFKIHQQKLQKVITQLQQFYQQAKEYSRDPTPNGRQELESLFNTITTQKTGYEVLDKRLVLTRRKRKRLLLFLDHPGIPIHNNQAERDLRPAVIIKKLSGGTKSRAGDRSFERHLSIIQTAKKQGLNVFKTLHGLLTNQVSPFVLTQRTAS